MQEPDIILADEPIASLDPRNTRIVMDALLRINRHFGITVICNLHSLDLARDYCDRLVGMSAGRIVFDGVPAALTEATARELYGLEAGEVMDEAPAPRQRRTIRLPPPGQRRRRVTHARSTTNNTNRRDRVMLDRRSLIMRHAACSPSRPAARFAQDWKAKYPELVFAIVPAENASGVTDRYAPLRRLSWRRNSA